MMESAQTAVLLCHCWIRATVRVGPYRAFGLPNWSPGSCKRAKGDQGFIDAISDHAAE